MSLLIVGDIHLGRSLSIGKPAGEGRLNSRVQDQLDLLKWIDKLAYERDVDHIVITGDVYHETRPHPELIKHFMSWCKGAHSEIHVIAGNHDIIRSGSYVSSALDIIPALDIEGVHVYKNPALVEMGELNVALLPFRDRRMYDVEDGSDALDKLRAEIDEYIQDTGDILIGHFALEGSLGIGDEISDTLNEIFLTPEWCKPWKKVWMGHIHHPQELYQTQDLYMAHTGSLDRSDFHKVEIDHEKRVVLVNDDGTFENITTPTRNMRDVEIEVPSDKQTTDYVINELCVYGKKKPLAEAILRLHVSMASSAEDLDRAKLQSYIYNKLEVHHVCGLTESRAVSEIEFDPEKMFDNQINPHEAVDKWLATRDEFDDDQQADRVAALCKGVIQEVEG